VLDTWFSSGLWPFSTLGWPDDTADLRAFYPNTVMETGSDIIFFWVARMMMMGIHFMGKPPFSTIYLHSIVRDEHGQKMSKSKGNGVDPLDLIYGAPKEKLSKNQQKAYPDGWPAFGTDAMRFTLAAASAAGRDIKLNLEQMQGYRAFCNKIWNASRFALMNLEGYTPRAGVPSSEGLADRWIRSRFSAAVEAVNAGLEAFNFSEAALALYHFFWNELCDWYVELAKPVLRGEAGDKAATQHNLVWIFDQTLRLLHPFMPYISEELWQALPIERESEFLIRADYPKSAARDLEAETQIALLVETITALRNIRGEHQLAPSKKLKAVIHTDKAACARLAKNQNDILRLAMLESVAFSDQPVAPQKETATSVVGAIQAVVSLEGLIDYAKEAERLRKEIGKMTTERERIRGKLANEGFVARAPAEVIAKEKEKVAELEAQLAKLTSSLAALS
jgi:valyl-tRNA synthetase